MKQRKVILLYLIILVFSINLNAIQKVWENDNLHTFSLGKPVNISIDSDGKMSLTPKLNLVTKVEDNYIVDVVESNDILYIAGGSTGKIFKFEKGELSVLTQFTGERILCLAKFPDGILVGVAPTGKVYRIKSDGTKTEFFNSNTNYIWSILEIKGSYYILTGKDPKLIKVSILRKSEVLFSSKASHLTRLTRFGENSLLFGETPTGIVYKYDIKSGKISILYDTPGQEVTGIDVSNDNKILITSVYLSGAKLPTLMTMPLINKKVVDKKETDLNEALTNKKILPPSGVPKYRSKGTGAMMFRVGINGNLEEVWSVKKNFILDSYFNRKFGWIVAFDTNGLVLKLEPEKLPGLFLKINNNTIVRIKEENKRIYILTGFPGEVYLLDSTISTSGYLESDVLDAGTSGDWGRIFWESITLQDTGVRIYTRSGNSENPGDYWEDWRGPYEKSGARILSSSARFLQWKIELTSGTLKVSPEVSSVKVTFTEKNIKPIIMSLKVTPPEFSMLIPKTSVNSRQETIFTPSTYSSSPSMPMKNTSGIIKVTWACVDDNFDSLVYSVYIRNINTGKWTIMSENLAGSPYEFDANYFDDGEYQVKLVVSDIPSHNKDNALENVQISNKFIIDNTPPKITKLKSISFLNLRVSDTHSDIARLDYQIDFKDWKSIVSDDEILDSKIEFFTLNLYHLKGGKHFILVRAIDKQGNAGYYRTTLDFGK
ncbi:hypothetical protein KAU33_00300 [Candidatus Dependentiae bacterium]|nr:hypothetical protein [Candidatus Dependentiae bacterium]